MEEKWPLYFDQESYGEFLVETAKKLADDCREMLGYLKPTPEEYEEASRCIEINKKNAGRKDHKFTKCPTARIDHIVSLDIAFRLHERVVNEPHESNQLEMATCLIIGQNILSRVIGLCLGVEFRASNNFQQARRLAAVNNGVKGAAVRHRPLADLKAWALSEAKGLRGDDAGIARTLAGRIPKHLVDASKNPERLIYDALREDRKKRIATQP